MKNLSEFIFVFIHMFTGIFIVHCEVENYFEDTLNPDEVINPHSFFYDKQTKKMVDDAPVAIINDNVQRNDNDDQNGVKSSEQTDNYSSHEIVFYKRLINLLLSNINIQEEDDVSITGTLQIEVSHSQMEILKNFDVHKTSLREIDDILSNIIQKPRNNYVVTIVYFFDMLQNAFDTVFRRMQQHPKELIIVSAILMICFMFKRIRWGGPLPILLFIQIIFILSFFMTWWHLLEEAEIKATAAQMKFLNIPLSCQPHKMWTWDKIVSLFSGDDCEQYYKTLMSNPKMKITPALVLSHLLTTVILQPFSHMGTIVSQFIENATAELSVFYAWIVKCILFSCIGFVISMLPFCLFGTSIDFGFGPLLRFGINNRKDSTKGNTLQSIENRAPVQVIIKLPQGSAVPQIQDSSESVRLQALQKGAHEIIASTDTDSQKRYKDLSSGDTIKNIECLEHHDVKKDTELDVKETEKKDGSGDA